VLIHPERREYPIFFYFQLNQDRKIKEAKCSCVSGIDGNCKHVFAVISFINSDQASAYASTSQKCEWSKPKCHAQPRGREIIGDVVQEPSSALSKKLKSTHQDNGEFDFDVEYERYFDHETLTSPVINKK
jgi:hypothetical protein